MDIARRSPNRLLAALPPAVFELMRPYLRHVLLEHETFLATTGEPLSEVYFPHSGIISLVVSLEDGEMVEFAMIGGDSVFGASAAIYGTVSASDAIVQAPGSASAIDIAPFRKAMEMSASFRDTLLRHEQVLLLQAQQSAACNACHSVEARLSRWLLRAHDLFDSDTLPLTQGFLAQMIGVRRNSVSLVANTLQQAGLVRYRRGQIEIKNLVGLRETACECYEAVKLRRDDILNNADRRSLFRAEFTERPNPTASA